MQIQLRKIKKVEVERLHGVRYNEINRLFGEN